MLDVDTDHPGDDEEASNIDPSQISTFGCNHTEIDFTTATFYAVEMIHAKNTCGYNGEDIFICDKFHKINLLKFFVKQKAFLLLLSETEK